MDRSALITYSSDQSSIARLTRDGIVYDSDTIHMLRMATQPGDIACDIGANFGYFTTLLSELASHVHAFEPDPANYLLLQSNLEGCDNVTTYPIAISDRDGDAEFFLSEGEFGNHSLEEMNVTDKISSIKVKTRTLDSFDFIPQIVKCDAQGAEAKIFRNAEKTLKQSRVFILFEFWPFGIQNMGDDPFEFIMSFQNYGLSLGIFAAGGFHRIEAGTEVRIGAKSSPNLVAFRGYDHLIAK